MPVNVTRLVLNCWTLIEVGPQGDDADEMELVKDSVCAKAAETSPNAKVPVTKSLVTAKIFRFIIFTKCFGQKRPLTRIDHIS